MLIQTKPFSLLLTGFLALFPALRPAPAVEAGRASPPKIGLVLSGGGARGGAHIGVLKVLEREGIPIDCIAGTSIGALVGGLYALGYPAAELETMLSSQDWIGVFSNTPERRITPLFERRDLRYQGQIYFEGFAARLPSGLFVGQRLTQQINILTTERLAAAGYDYDRLPIPFRAVATDLVTGKPYVFRSGRMSEAIRASIAIPMVFTPVEKDGMLLVDGGLVDNLPTDVARDMGADIVIAVDVTSPLKKQDEIRTLFDVVDQSISLQIRRSVERSLAAADMVLRPELEGVSGADFDQLPEIVERGERAANSQLENLRNLVRSAGRARRPPAAQKETQAATIESVRFEGLRIVPSSRLRNEVKTRVGDTLDMDMVDRDLRTLYATRLFEQVDSELLPLGQNRYQLNYLLDESPMNTLGGSIRYDRDYKFVALAEFTARQLFHSPSILTLSAQFGGLTDASAGLRYIPSALPSVFIEPKVHHRRRERLDMRDRTFVDRYTERRTGGQLVVGASWLKGSEFEIGYRYDEVKIVGGTLPNRQEEPRALAGITLRYNRDSLDEQEFPATGTRARVQIDERRRALGGDFTYSKWQADWNQFFRLSEKGTLELRLGAGLSDREIPFYDQFYLGGYTFSQGAARPLLGYRLDELLARQAGTASLGYRRRLTLEPVSFARRVFLSGYYNIAAVSREKERPYRFRYYHGGGLVVSLDTPAGPIHLAGGWGEEGRFNFHLSLGPGF